MNKVYVDFHSDQSLSHLVFYDETCGLCDRVVKIILSLDQKHLFCFASLQGKTAQQLLKDFPHLLKDKETFVLIQNFKKKDREFFFFGKGALRVFWLLGGRWKVIGCFSFFPSFFYDWAYRLVAKHRQRFFSQSCLVQSEEDKERFFD